MATTNRTDLGKKIVAVLVACLLIVMINAGPIFAGTFSEGGSACGNGSHTFMPTTSGTVTFTYYGDVGSYASIYLYGSPYANVYNGSVVQPLSVCQQ